LVDNTSMTPQEISSLDSERLLTLFENMLRVSPEGVTVETCRNEIRYRLGMLEHQRDSASPLTADGLGRLLLDSRVRVAERIAQHRGTCPVTVSSDNTRWLHEKSQKTYLFEDVVLQEATVTPGVVYSTTQTRPLIKWFRPLDQFLDRFKPLR
jgi:hypothetical protein